MKLSLRDDATPSMLLTCDSAMMIAAATQCDMNQAAERVYQTVGRITAAAEQYGKAPHVVARRMAERRIDLIGSLGAAGSWRNA